MSDYRLWNIDQQLEHLAEVSEEDMPAEEWHAAVEALGREKNDAILSLCRLYKFQKAKAAAAKEVAKSFNEDAKSKEAKADRTLRSIIKYSDPSMVLEDDYVKMTWRQSAGQVVVDNEFLIPDSCWRQRDPEIDKSAISKLLKAGTKVPGCHLEKPKKINIK